MTAKITSNKTMDQLQKIYDAIANYDYNLNGVFASTGSAQVASTTSASSAASSAAGR